MCSRVESTGDMQPSAQIQEGFSYELLLRKTCDVELIRRGTSDGASTENPATASLSSSASAAGSIPSTVHIPDRVQLLCNMSVHEPNTDERTKALLSQTRQLSWKVFDEDCLQEVTKKSGWKLSLLVSHDMAMLCGFILSRVKNGSLSIAKIAVPAHFRGQGFGKRIMDEVMKAAKKQRDVFDVCLSSLPGAVTFYQRLGFKAFHDLKASSDEDLVEGQVYMEKKLRQRQRQRRG